jgi:hypothetical protein
VFNSSRRLPFDQAFVNPPVFIIGSHRAGSTLWHNLIAMTPGMLRLPEARFLGSPRQKDFRYFLRTQVGDLSEDGSVEKLVRLCFSRRPAPGLGGALWKWKGMELADEPALHEAVARKIKESDRKIGSIARILLEELARFSGCSRACVKFPVDIRHIPELMNWFPDGKVVHITRDPRALAMSKSNDPSGTAPLVQKYPYLSWPIRKAALAVVISNYRVSAKMHSRLKSKPNYRLFRYEDLLADPEKTLRELCEFIDTEFLDDMLEPQKGEHEHQPSSLTGKQQKAFDAEAAIRWQGVISPLDNFLVAAATRSSMEQLGYNPATHPIFQKDQASQKRVRPAIASG